MTKKDAWRWLYIAQQEWVASERKKDADGELFFLFMVRGMKSFLRIPMGPGRFPAWLLREVHG